MQPKELATLGCGGLSTTMHNSPFDEQLSSPAVPPSYTCARRSAEPGVSTASRKAAVVLVVRTALIVLGFLTWRGMNFVAETAKPPTSNWRQSPALTLARDTKARQIQFRFSPYAERTGSRLIFSEAALRSLAQRLFPSSRDALKRRKLLEVASRIDLSNDILDLTPAHKITQLRAKLEQATKRFGRPEKQLRNPLEFSNAVRLAFHSFVNKQEVKAMAALHMENPQLAKQLENVNVTAELRHLIASALPAIQPANPTPEEKAALNKISSFYADLTSIRQQLMEKAMKKVDSSTPVDLSNVFEEGAITIPTPLQIETFVKTAQSEAEKRVADVYRKMAPTEKLDFASAGLTVAQLRDAVFEKLVHKVRSDSTENTITLHAMQTVKRKTAENIAEKNYAAGQRAAITAITLVSLFGILAAAAYGVQWKLRVAQSQWRGRRKQSESEGEQIDLNMEELATMPLSALRSKALSKRRNKARRRSLRDEGKYVDQTNLQFKGQINVDQEPKTKAPFVFTTYRHH